MSSTTALRIVGLLAAVAMCGVAAAVAASGTDSGYASLQAAANVLIVGAPILVGLQLVRRQPFERCGWMLVASSAGWCLATLSSSRVDVLYSTGRVSGWIAEALFAFLMLSFPTGRLETRVDRAIVGGIFAVIAIAFVPSALLVEHYPEPSTWSTCDTHCPANAFMLVSAEPAWVDDVLRPVRELAIVLLTGAGAMRLAVRLRGATKLMRRMLSPVLQVTMVRLALYATTLFGRIVAHDRDADVVRAGFWLIALTIPALAIAFLAGSIRWQLFIGACMQRLAARLRARPSREDLRDALADAFEDPTLQLAYPADGGWVDEDGRPVSPRVSDSSRVLTEIRDGRRPVAAVVHDAALEAERGFIDCAASVALMTVEYQRLQARSAALLDELRASRARVVAEADGERQRIQRDLHDGAQQRLIALRVRLDLAAEQIVAGDRNTRLMKELGRQVDDAIEDLRGLVHGVYPATLTTYGVAEALRGVARGMPVATSVSARGIGRYPAEIEHAAYFCCLEALQNAAKHAEGTTAIAVTMTDDGALRLEVRDDGTGFDVDAVHTGCGLANMRDRIAVVGGTVTLESCPESGTTVSAIIPLDGASANAAHAGS